MFDEHKRKINYMRVSITDRCNLRCIYCMPREGITLFSHEEVLTYGEIEKVCKSVAALGIERIKITGGEPLVRKGAVELVRKVKAIDGISQVTLTTNGVLLEEYMDQLAEAGIDGINISVDSLDPKIYEEITGFNMLDKVYKGIEKALKYENIPLKVNCVPFKVYQQNINEIVSLAKNNPIHVRFIEMMPIGHGKEQEYINEEELAKEIEKEYGKLKPFSKKLGNGPCRYFTIEGFKGKIGFISAISHKFCDSCNRVRLTSHGHLKTCLQYEEGEDLRKLLREGISDVELAEVIKKKIMEKPEGHIFRSDECTFKDKEFKGIRENELLMSEIGG